MGTKKVVVNGETILLPEYYQRVESMPDDPEESVPFMVQTENAACFVLLFPVGESQSLPRRKEDLIAGIRQYLGENQGLIQVETDESYVFSIVKTLKEPSGVQYALTYQRFCEGFILNIQAFFEELGRTGMRENYVYEMCRKKGIVGADNDPFKGWSRDSYDESIKTGTRMNISEEEQFDEMFPGFPLTMCREFLKTIIR